MSDNGSVPNIGITSDEQIRKVLRRHISKALDSREFTRESLATETGVNIHTIDAIKSHDKAKHRRIAAEDAFCIAYTLGGAAVNALIGTIHYTARRTDEVSKVAPMMMAANAMEGLAVITKAVADGWIDHTEEPACRDAADYIIASVTPLSSAGEGA